MREILVCNYYYILCFLKHTMAFLPKYSQQTTDAFFSISKVVMSSSVASIIYDFVSSGS